MSGKRRALFAAAFSAALLPRFAASAPPGSVDWNTVCYRAFGEHANALAGADAIDCGFYRDGKGAFASRECLRAAIRDRASFKVGVSGFGTDSEICDAVVRDANGIYWEIDVDIPFDRGAWVNVNRCERVRTTRRSLRVFIAEKCKFDHAATRRIRAIGAHDKTPW